MKILPDKLLYIAAIQLIIFVPFSSIAAPTQESSFAVNVAINANLPGKKFNPLLLGNNLEWNNRGDTLLKEDGSFNSESLERIHTLAPTILRFPGGTQSDMFEWEKTIGPIKDRAIGHATDGRPETYLFGVDEFLALTKNLNMARLFTFNVLNSKPESLAALARYTKDKGGIDFWEIGNEPYLITEPPELAKMPADIKRNISPEEFAKKANSAIHALREVEPKAHIGLPLRSDRMNDIPSPYQGYNDTVLGGIKEQFDFVALHSAYMPEAFLGIPDENTLYLATVAGAASVEADMKATRAQLAHYFPNRHIPLAFTEYNALVSLGKPTDGLLASLASALYVADTIRLFAQDGDVLLANFWSLLDNWHFGLITKDGSYRPAYYVLLAYRALADGAILPTQTNSPEFDSPSLGFSKAAHVPWVTSMAVNKEGAVLLVLINRHPRESADTTIQLEGVAYKEGGKLFTLQGPEAFAGAEGRAPVSWTAKDIPLTRKSISLALPPHSFTILKLLVK